MENNLKTLDKKYKLVYENLIKTFKENKQFLLLNKLLDLEREITKRD